MSLHIYNPPAPHGHPVTGYVDQRSGERCGLCFSCPPDWLLDCDPVAPPFDAMGGKFRLSRRLSNFKIDTTQACAWDATVVLSPLSPPPSFLGIWSLYFGTPPESIGTGPLTWWVVADVRQFNTPNDIAAWLPDSPAAPVAGAHWTQHRFNCLGPNVFADLQLGIVGLGFPLTVKVQPLWA